MNAFFFSIFGGVVAYGGGSNRYNKHNNNQQHNNGSHNNYNNSTVNKQLPPRFKQNLNLTPTSTESFDNFQFRPATNSLLYKGTVNLKSAQLPLSQQPRPVSASSSSYESSSIGSGSTHGMHSIFVFFSFFFFPLCSAISKSHFRHFLFCAFFQFTHPIICMAAVVDIICPRHQPLDSIRQRVRQII